MAKTRIKKRNPPKIPEEEHSTMKKPKVEIIDLDKFQFKPISDRGTTVKDAISVEQYSEDRELQFAISASLSNSKRRKRSFIDLENEGEENECVVRFLNSETRRSSNGKQVKPFLFPSVSETGQSSNCKTDFVCDLCVEPKSVSDSFRINGCSHAYCTDCMAKYVASKLQDNITGIMCPEPGCTGCLEPEYCRSILPEEVFDRWGNALCEAVILGSQKFYCPYKDCSALMLDDGQEIIKESECPNCRRLFCVQCKVCWHAGIDCEEFQKLNKDEREKEDIMLMKLARDKSWRRCPKCRIFVERTEGCLYMKCRCQTGFCYNCGSVMTLDHYCKNCKR